MTSILCFRPFKKQVSSSASYGPSSAAGGKQNGHTKKAGNGSMAAVSEEGLSLQYITPRIIAITSPENGSERAYRATLKTVSQQLKKKHFEHYKIYNVSRKRSDLGRTHPVVDVGWPGDLAPPLDRLCSVCKQWELWLGAHPKNVVVVHSRGFRSRAALLVASFMHYNHICANDDTVEDRISMQGFADRFIGANGQPSHKRYLTYFASLLSGRTRVNPAAVYLQRIHLSRFPSHNVHFKVYERQKPVYSTAIMATKDVTKVDLDETLKLRGDVLVKCIERRDNNVKCTLFACQFNTCALDFEGRPPVLLFYKEELDLIFADQAIDNQASVEFHFTTTEPSSSSTSKIGTPLTRKKSLGETSRTDSYEFFDLPEDETGETVEYSEIQKKASTNGSTSNGGGGTAPSSEDSGISVESPKHSDEGTVSGSSIGVTSTNSIAMLPPAVPPKPRPDSTEPAVTSTSVDADLYVNEVPDEEERPVARGVLPAQVRPVVERSQSPKDGRTTPSIIPDLVGKDRYDKASKCFSYVPAKDLKQHFIAPKKPPPTPKVEERANLDIRPSPDELSKVPIQATDLQRTPDVPTWGEQVDQAKQMALREASLNFPARRTVPERRSHSVAGERYNNGHRYADEDEEERAVVVDQARTATRSRLPRKTKYGSYRTLNDEAYSSDMDDLCDPEYYLSFNQNTSDSRNRGSQSVQLPRKTYNQQPDASIKDVLDELLDANPVPPQIPLTGLPPKAQPTNSLLDLSEGGGSQPLAAQRDAFRARNCRSVTTTPYMRERKLFADDRYDSTTDATDADDWLTTKLRKLKTKKDNDPDALRRRHQEKILLEELKNTHGDAARTRNEDFAVEGYGHSQADPLAEYKREEERLRNTHSPFEPTRGGRSSVPLGRGVVRGKPPTPPPTRERERSRSPPLGSRSPFPNRSGLYTPSADSYTNGEAYNDDFSSLRDIVQGTTPSQSLHRTVSGASETSGARPILKRPSYGASDFPTWQRSERGETPTTPFYYVSGQERVASALDRAETPSFPVKRETPVPFHPLLYNNPNGQSNTTLNYRSASPRSQYYGHSRRSSLTSLDPSEIIHHHPVFVKDTSKYWYKPTISREQAITMLRDKPPGTFVVRDSNSFPGAFGMALKVAQPPPGVAPGDGTELVRHFLIEPSPKGVKLKGCNNEPVFGSLSALVYQHSITPLALPTKLILPDYDPASSPEHVSATQALLEQGAACNVTYIASVDMESLTGNEAVRRAVAACFEMEQRRFLNPISVHFKVSSQGITLTDNTRKVFFRRHYPVQTVIFAGIDPAERRWDNTKVPTLPPNTVPQARLFGFVARKLDRAENACHIFAELEPEQPASAVINFINKVMLALRR